MGIERLMELIKMPDDSRDGYYLGALDDEAISTIISATQKLRKTFKATCDYKKRNLQKHLKAADKVNAKYCAVIGSNELKDATIWIKNLQNKTEKIISLKEL
jgi:histidyl-tRNA synthetase